MRLLLLLRSPGGLTGLVGYDSGVYYAASDALLHGRMPYRDFLLLHPPGVMLALTPFAALGRLTTDETGFVTANLVFMAIGGINAALVLRVARRLGASTLGAALGGVAYAAWVAAAIPEVSARLEPLGNLLLLGALARVARPGDERNTRRVVSAGILLGLACTVKLWWLLPLLIVGGWLAGRARSWAIAVRYAAGAAAAFVIVAGPFFVAAPSAMFRMLVRDQLGRARDLSTAGRIEDLLGVHDSAGSLVRVAIVAVGLAAVLLAIVAVRRGQWLPVVLAVANLAVLLAVPHYSGFYSGFVSVPVVLVLAVAVDARWVGKIPAAALVLAMAAEAANVLYHGTGAHLSAPFPRTKLAGAVAHVRCLMSDSPMALIDLDALSRGLADGCPNWVDVTGRSYDADPGTGRAAAHRSLNAKWQADALRYLRSGDAVILVRTASGLTKTTRQRIEQGTLLVRSGRYAVYRTRPG